MKVTLLRSQWEQAGETAGWLKDAQKTPNEKKPHDPDDIFGGGNRDEVVERMVQYMNRDQNREALKGVINVSNGDWHEFVNGSFDVARKAAPAILKNLDLLVRRSRAPRRGWQARDNISALREKLITPQFRDEIADAIGRAAIQAVAETIRSE